MGKKIVLIVMLLSLSLFSGCGHQNSATTEENTLIYGGVTDPSSLNPLLGSDSACNEVQSLIFNSLVKINSRMEIVPDLAQSWEIRNQGREYVFHLRQGINWHDGKPFTSEDAAFTFRKILDPQAACDMAGEFQDVKDILPEKDKITFRLKKPDGAFLSRVALVCIVPHHLLAQEKNIRETPFNEQPIGTGPYRFVERKRAQYLKFVANENYYAGKPGIKELYYKIVPDANVLALQLQKGEIDLSQLDARNYEELKKDQRLQFFAMPGQAYSFLALNNRLPLFADQRVRKALALGHNRKKVIENILKGHAYLAKGDLPPLSWGYDDSLPYLNYNPQEALGLLAQAGWQKDSQGNLSKGGAKFSFTLLIASNNGKNKDLALAFQQDMKELGIQVRILPIDFNVLRQKHLLAHNFEACVMSQRLGLDPDSRFQSWHSKGAFNFSGLNNKEVDRLLEEGRQTVELEKRKAIYQQIQKILLEEQPFIFHNYPEIIIGAQKNITGISQKGMGAKDNIFWNISQWKKKGR